MKSISNDSSATTTSLYVDDRPTASDVEDDGSWDDRDAFIENSLREHLGRWFIENGPFYKLPPRDQLTIVRTLLLEAAMTYGSVTLDERFANYQRTAEYFLEIAEYMIEGNAP